MILNLKEHECMGALSRDKFLLLFADEEGNDKGKHTTLHKLSHVSKKDWI